MGKYLDAVVDIGDSRQEIFDRVVQGLAAQKWRRSVAEKGERCVYINARGDRCAVGHLLGEYAKDTVVGVLALYDSGDIRVSRDLLGFLRSLQCLHDNFTGEVMRDEFKFFAHANSLQWNLPQQEG
jgi:hypothetical protein